MMRRNSISIVVPALNEQLHLERAVTNALAAVRKHFDDYEILVFNDGSVDGTGEVAEALARRYEHVHAFHNKTPQNVGGVIHAGLQLATKHWFIWVDGKGATPTEALDTIFAHRHQADLVVPFTINQHERSFARRLIHNLYCAALNLTFHLDLKHYTHLVLCRREDAKRFTIRTRSYAYQSEQLIKLIKSGASYVQVGVSDYFNNEKRATKAFKLRNILGVAAFYFRTIYDVHVRGQCRKAKPAGLPAVTAAANVHEPV